MTPGVPKPSFFRRLLRPAPKPEETPERRFERVHRAFFWFGFAPILGIGALLAANTAAQLRGAPSISAMPLVIALAALILPETLLMWVGTAMKRGRPWSRKAAASVVVAGILAIAAGFIGAWIFVSDLALSLFYFTQSYPGAGLLPVALPSIVMIFVLAVPVIGMSAAVVVAGARLFSVYEYLVSDEAKRFFDEAGPETKSAP